MDEVDPIPGHYTLEVTSPGLERQLRTAAHFQREIGKTVTLRFADPAADPRRIDGQLVAADEHTATLLLDSGDERVDRHQRHRQGAHRVRVRAETETRHREARQRRKSGTAKSGTAKSGTAKAKNSKQALSETQHSTPTISKKETQPS